MYTLYFLVVAFCKLGFAALMAIGLLIGKSILLENTSVLESPSIPATSVSSTPTLEYDTLVVYTGSGYSPENLEVPIGSRVAFKNTTSIPMWTASDPHPVHSDFSAFDARRSFGRDEIYIYQFPSTGTFGFHNHEKSIHRGLIKVFDPKNPKVSIDKTKESSRKKRDTLLALLDPADSNSVFTLIDTIEASYSLSRDCHDMAHDLGHKAYELYGFSAAMTFGNPNESSHTSADDICAGGYMHGILEEVFLHRPELSKAPKGLCDSISSTHRGSCYHGIGHGLMFAHKRDVQASLLSCRTLETLTDTYRCFEGVWMEMFWGNVDHSGAKSLGWNLANPIRSCARAKADERPTCILYAHLGYLRTHPRDYAGVVNFCIKSDLLEQDEAFCLKGIGITMMKRFTSKRLGEAEDLVGDLSEKQKSSYYDGIIGYSLLSGIPQIKLSEFCNALKTDSAICNTQLSEVIGTDR